MNFIKRLSGWILGPGSYARFYPLDVRCNRCGEVINAQVNLSNDLSIDYEAEGGRTVFHCRKVLIGKERCFQQIEVSLTFDTNRKLLERQIAGGAFVDSSSA